MFLYNRGVAIQNRSATVQNQFSGWVYPVSIRADGSTPISTKSSGGVDIKYPSLSGGFASATKSGIVIASYDGKYGSTVVIDNTKRVTRLTDNVVIELNKWLTLYTNMHTRLVQKGDRVRTGQGVGVFKGHLHFELWSDVGVVVDPRKYMEEWKKLLLV